MFNVSVLLLDDALKPATPLTNGAINETLRRLALHPQAEDEVILRTFCWRGRAGGWEWLM